MGSSHTLDQLDICFDDTHAGANAGPLLPATLAERLGIQQTADAPCGRLIIAVMPEPDSDPPRPLWETHRSVARVSGGNSEGRSVR
jgi:hypothetical protein